MWNTSTSRTLLLSRNVPAKKAFIIKPISRDHDARGLTFCKASGPLYARYYVLVMEKVITLGLCKQDKRESHYCNSSTL